MTKSIDSSNILVDAYDFVEVCAMDLPVHCMAAYPGIALTNDLPAAALPASGRVANGRGLSRDGCRASALGEAIELASCCSWGDEPLLAASQRDINMDFCAVDELLGLSPSQWAQRHIWNRRFGDFDRRPMRCDETRSIDWYVAENATGKQRVAVPADLVLIGRHDADDVDAIGFADSNGCASAATHEDARVIALLELIERDATARWWYGGRKRPLVALDFLDSQSSLRNALESRSRVTRLFDITTDIGVSCIAAVSAEADGSCVAMGFSANPDAAVSACSALVEMAQIELSLQAAIIHDQMDAGMRCWLQQVNGNDEFFDAATFTGKPEAQFGDDTKVLLSELLQHCRAASCRVFFANLTRPRFGVPVYRALSPDLCHYKPRFARARLLSADERDLEPVDCKADMDSAKVLFI
ncbi:MAG: YcaO-like family protein [Gammaproteobacteria bacterium]|nr:YcaO-like family protein [Gammaproteobacteria bacterium]